MGKYSRNNIPSYYKLHIMQIEITKFGFALAENFIGHADMVE